MNSNKVPRSYRPRAALYSGSQVSLPLPASSAASERVSGNKCAAQKGQTK